MVLRRETSSYSLPVSCWLRGSADAKRSVEQRSKEVCCALGVAGRALAGALHPQESQAAVSQKVLLEHVDGDRSCPRDNRHLNAKTQDRTAASRRKCAARQHASRPKRGAARWQQIKCKQKGTETQAPAEVKAPLRWACTQGGFAPQRQKQQAGANTQQPGAPHPTATAGPLGLPPVAQETARGPGHRQQRRLADAGRQGLRLCE